MKTRLLIAAALMIAGPSFAAEPTAAPAPATAPAAAAVPPITDAELTARLESKDDSLIVLDVRTPREFAAGHVPGARNISHDELAARLDELTGERDKEVVLYCRSGRRSAMAAETLRGAGFTKLRQLQGDYPAWESAKRPIETSPAPQAAPVL